MKNFLTIIFFSLLLTGCSLGQTTSSQQDGDTTPDTSSYAFSIVVADNIQPLLTDDDIFSYNKNTHTLTITADGIKKINTYSSTGKSNGESITPLISSSLYQQPFRVLFNGIELYQGKFWSLASSVSYDGIVLVEGGENKLVIHAGYPALGEVEGKDPRVNEELFTYLRHQGTLIE